MEATAEIPTVRRAQPGDLDALLPLVRGYREFYRQPPDPPEERRFIERHLAERTSCIFLAERGSRSVGFVQLFRTWSTVHLAPSLILEDLFVEPSARGCGTARALLAAAFTYAKETGAAGMFLETAYDNHAAQRLYEAAGWTREAQFQKFNAPPLTGDG